MRDVLVAALLGSALLSMQTSSARAQVAAPEIPPAPSDVAAPPPPDAPPAPLPELPPPPPSSFAEPASPMSSVAALEAPMDRALTGRVLALLAHQRDTYGLARIVGGVASLASAALFLGLGFVPWEESDAFLWSGLFTAPLLVAVGIALLTTTMPQEDRYERFKLALADGMSAIEYAGVSGELRAESNLARSQRMLGGAMSLGIAGSGALTLLMVTQLYTGSSGPDGALLDILVYSFPAALLATGLLTALYSFLVKTQPEKDWDALQAGVPPESLVLDVRVSPFVTADGGGLAAVGRF